jgi:hypothetical protein
MASAQLQLITTDHTWKLDRQTVEVGKAGIAQARAALAAATAVSDTEGQLFDWAVGRVERQTEPATSSAAVRGQRAAA